MRYRSVACQLFCLILDSCPSEKFRIVDSLLRSASHLGSLKRFEFPCDHLGLRTERPEIAALLSSFESFLSGYFFRPFSTKFPIFHAVSCHTPFFTKKAGRYPSPCPPRACIPRRLKGGDIDLTGLRPGPYRIFRLST